MMLLRTVKFLSNSRLLIPSQLNHCRSEYVKLTARTFASTPNLNKNLRIAIIGQSQFGADVTTALKKAGHEIAGVFTVQDSDGRPDPLAQTAEKENLPVFKIKQWRKKGQPIQEIFEQYKSVNADLNVLPFCTQFIPMPVIQYPKYESICYHPSILPRGRGASAINWTLIKGDKKAGFSVFWADDGLDTGPILLQRECDVDPDDNVDSIYLRFLFPEGVKAMVEAVNMVADGTAPKIKQSEEGSTYDAMLKKSNVQINFDQSAEALHNFIRGTDKVPGAWANIDGKPITFYGSKLWRGRQPRGTEVEIQGLSKPAVVHRKGMAFFGNDGNMVNVSQLQYENGKLVDASSFGQEEDHIDIGELTAEESEIKEKIRDIWKGILLRPEITPQTAFFQTGVGSMEAVRLVEEIKQKCKVELTSDDVYKATNFDEFIYQFVLKHRGLDKKEFVYDAVNMHVNEMDIKFPNQLFINNRFRDASDGGTFKTINPATEEVICDVAKGTKDDVDDAVYCAQDAFEGDWGTMNARDRGYLMQRLADLMEQHQDELATIETIDSGAVYTLAQKTHVGMSIATFRYAGGWCDKIHGKTIPINHARPNRNLTYTKREPIGVCGIVTPWNYPLMMLAWKAASCLAAGNTLVLKPAQVTPLTSLKFCELAVKAGFPPGTINVLPGSGSVVGQALTDHMDIRKVGFTGSTAIGKGIMESCAASNVKRVSLELGGKSPLIIFSDCDMDKAVRMGLSSVFFNKGENCIAAGRLFVEEDIHDEYLARVIAEVKKMKIGDPFDRSVDHGPQNHMAHLKSLLDYCETGVKEGARIVYGGKRCDRPGLFMEPTIITDVEDHMFLAQEESFGPIMVVSKFRKGDIEGVIRSANNVEYGLASGVFTKDISKALTVADRLDAGTVFVNTYNKTDVASPFGGFKQSGFGKDLGEDALNEYLRTKAVTIEY